MIENRKRFVQVFVDFVSVLRSILDISSRLLRKIFFGILKGDFYLKFAELFKLTNVFKVFVV